MQLGIGSYTYTWGIGVPGHIPLKPMTAFDVLDEAKRLGVRLVQFCDNLPLVQLPPTELEQFKRRVREDGLAIELGTRGLGLENLRANLKLAQEFGCSFLRIVLDSPGDHPAPEEAVKRFQPVLPEFQEAGVKLAIENHDRFSSATLALMVRELGVERVGICLDTVNSFGALEGPEVVVENLGEFTLCLHVKDFTIRRVSHQMGFVVEGCAAGQGRLNVPWLLEKLQSCPHAFNGILETWVTPSDSLEETIARERAWTEEGVKYLRGLSK